MDSGASKNKLYREIFLKSKRAVEKKIAGFKSSDEAIYYLDVTLKNEILSSENEIKAAFNKIKCIQCGVCCRFAVSEFSPGELLKRAKAGDRTSKSFLETFELYSENIPPSGFKDLAEPYSLQGCYFYHCKKAEIKNGKYFCPIYHKRPDVCRNFPDTPLERLPKTCAYNVWKDENEIKAMYIKALNDVRKFYLDETKKDSTKKRSNMV